MKKVFLIDLDGTLYIGKTALPYAEKFIDFLNANAYKYLALTNCPSLTQKQISKKLMKMNINISPDNILTSGMVTAKILSEKYKIKSVYALSTSALKTELKKQGISIQKKAAQAVVVGYDTSLTYKKLSFATNLINNGAMFFLTNIDNDIPHNNCRVPHTGAISKAVEFATGKECTYIGKPQAYMLDAACEILDCNRNDCVMIGDRIDTDILFAKSCSIKSYLVLGENDSKADVCNCIAPDYIFNNLSEVIYKEEEEQHVSQSI